MKKMNNKGFSLVELIVVVLIMAIIAVALAPQVMKWVENSRKSTDASNYDSIVSACNVALSNEKVYAKAKAKTGAGAITFTASATDSQYVPANDEANNNNGDQLQAEMTKTLGDNWLQQLKVKASVLDSKTPAGDPGIGYLITIDGCEVIRSKAPYTPNS